MHRSQGGGGTWNPVFCRPFWGYDAKAASPGLTSRSPNARSFSTGMNVAAADSGQLWQTVLV